MFKSFISTRSLIASAVIGAACLAAAPKAHADGVGVSASIGTNGTQFSANAIGAVSSISQGSAVAASQVNGFGGSHQYSDANTRGSGTVGAKLDNIGGTVMTGSQQVAEVNSNGYVYGNAPIMEGTLVANGTAAFADTRVNAAASGNFATSAFGAHNGFNAAVGHSKF